MRIEDLALNQLEIHALTEFSTKHAIESYDGCDFVKFLENIEKRIWQIRGDLYEKNMRLDAENVKLVALLERCEMVVTKQERLIAKQAKLMAHEPRTLKPLSPYYVPPSTRRDCVL